jgi:hypothetical protein
MSIPIIKNITPPTILKLFTEIPKKLNNNWPEKAKKTIVMNETHEALLAVFFLFSLSNEDVIVIKIGIVPRGFISVKKEVKHRSPKDINSFMIRN